MKDIDSEILTLGQDEILKRQEAVRGQIRFKKEVAYMLAEAEGSGETGFFKLLGRLFNIEVTQGKMRGRKRIHEQP